MKARTYKSKHAERYSDHKSLDVMSTEPTFAYATVTKASDRRLKSASVDVDGITNVWIEPHQLSLNLVSKDDTIDELKNAIERYERGYDRLANFAYRWEELMKSVDENEDIEQLFVQIQMLRKLKGENLG